MSDVSGPGHQIRHQTLLQKAQKQLQRDCRTAEGVCITGVHEQIQQSINTNISPLMTYRQLWRVLGQVNASAIGGHLPGAWLLIAAMALHSCRLLARLKSDSEPKEMMCTSLPRRIS